MASSSLGAYLRESRAPRYSLTFALPLLALYEVLAAVVAPANGGVRNGADVLLKGAFLALAGRHGPLAFAVLLVGALLVLAVRDARRAGARLRGPVFAVMLAESAVLATLFGVVVGFVTAQLLGALVGAPALAAGAAALSRPTAFVVSLGAGLYEELLFRVLLVSLLLWGGRHLMGWGAVASTTAAVLVGALVFSAFHYVGPYGDDLQLASFTFRAIAGVAFSALYVARGFGITAWTHALYDVFLLVT